MIRTNLLMLTAICLAVQAHAVEPTVTLLQGFGPGGNADTIARIVAHGLSEELQRTVVVDAKTGAGGNVASAAVAKAKPDGNTLILMTGGHAVSAAVYRTQPFHPVDDFEWLTTVTRFPFVVATSSQSPYQTLPDVIAAAKAAPGQLSFSSVGIGSTQHLSGELLQSMAGVRLNHIPYRGGGAPVQDVIAGRVDLLFDSVTVARAQVEGGRLRALAVTSPVPTPLLPGVPSVSKSVPGFEVISWTAVAAPRGLPPEVSERLRTALAKVLRSPDVVRQLEGTGGEVAASSDGAATRAFVQSQVAKWKRVATDARIEQQ